MIKEIICLGIDDFVRQVNSSHAAAQIMIDLSFSELVPQIPMGISETVDDVNSFKLSLDNLKTLKDMRQ
ncbi:hypothetical protein ABEB36_013788 [Hypothenemus hampei]|uniref:Uncharacterized protein n=1 Tax=Hypothenemus hampei TaxID=57062 RepID=A0ABD1E808_HYPHA